ncbi:MAG: hypothetical protein ACREML_00140 [Vulcanimicrobiaceae bacterium]
MNTYSSDKDTTLLKRGDTIRVANPLAHRRALLHAEYVIWEVGSPMAGAIYCAHPSDPQTPIALLWAEEVELAHPALEAVA